MSIEKLLNIMKELSKDGVIKTSKKDLVELYGNTSTAQITRLLNTLEKQGYIKTIKKAKNLGGGNWSPYIWEINKIDNKEVNKKHDNVKLTDVIKENVNEYKNITSILNYTQDKFNNIDIDVIDTEMGKVILVSHIYNALGLSRQAIHQMLNRNKELFDGMVFNINMGDGDKVCVTKEGVIGLLMKMQYERLKEDKKQLVLQFQKWCMETLSQVITSGEIKLKDKEQQEVKSTVKQCAGLNDKDIDKLFEDIEDLLCSKIHDIKTVAKELREDRDQYKIVAESEKQRNERLIANAVTLREKIYSAR